MFQGEDKQRQTELSMPSAVAESRDKSGDRRASVLGGGMVSRSRWEEHRHGNGNGSGAVTATAYEDSFLRAASILDYETLRTDIVKALADDEFSQNIISNSDGRGIGKPRGFPGRGPCRELPCGIGTICRPDQTLTREPDVPQDYPTGKSWVPAGTHSVMEAQLLC
jgi:hypothetical protein